MYADDVFLVSSTAAGLMKHVNILLEFCQKWKLDVNPEKNVFLDRTNIDI